MDKSGPVLYIVGTIRVEDELRRAFEEMGCKVVDMPNRRINTFRYFLELIKFIRKKDKCYTCTWKMIRKNGRI